MKKFWFVACAILATGLTACGDSSEIEPQDPPVRPIKSFIVSDAANSIIRSFPSVLEPSESSELSFEAGGQIGPVDLRIGQTVRKGDVLLSIDPKSLALEVDRAKTDVEQTTALLSNAQGTFERQEQLLKDGFTTRASFEDAEAKMKSAEADLSSAKTQLSLAEENLSKSEITAPFDGTISRINVEAFDFVSAGSPVISIYNSTAFELSFAAPPTIVNGLSVGQPVIVRVAQRRELELDAELTEIGARADSAGAFPATATLLSPVAGLKSGMAAEIDLELSIAGGNEGFLVPIHALVYQGEPPEEPGTTGNRQAQVYRYDADTETVAIQEVVISGVRDNMVIVTGGLSAGDRIASAGVSFLFDGQTVTLLEGE